METDERPVQGPPRPDVSDRRMEPLTALEQAEVDAEAARLRSRGMSYREIGRAMGCSHQGAYARVQRALAAVAYEAVEELRETEKAHLLELRAKAYEILCADSPLVSQGRVMKDVEGNPLPDLDLPLRAMDRLVRISESLRKLTGADMPLRTEHKVTVEETTVTDNEIRSMIDQMRANEAVAEAHGEPV